MLKKINKKKIGTLLIIFTILIMTVFFIQYIKNIKSNSIARTENSIQKINEEYFDISFDINKKTANIDGDVVNITDLFMISEKYLDELLLNNNFETFISENLIGDIEYNKDSISVKNPYSTKTLIAETSDKSVFENYDNIISVREIVDNIYIIDYKNALDTKQGYEDLQKNECIKNIITDHKITISDNTSQIQSISSENIAWGVTSTGMGNYSTKLNYMQNNEEIIVAVLDSGVNTSHEAFCIEETADRIIFENSYDYVNDDSDAADDNGHGTQVAGAIAESTSNNIKILPVKVIGSDGEGYFSYLLEAIDDINEYVDIINLSLGTSTSDFSTSDLEILEAFFEEIYNSGTIVVCAAGNSNEEVSYPAASAYTLAAAAIDSSNNKAYFSNYGEEIDFALPGVNLKLPSYTSNNAYSTVSGTSFSSPFLASAVALVKAEYGYNEIDEIINVLKDNSEDLGDEGKDIYFGYGSINFNSFMFKNPVIVKTEVIETTWANENTIVVYAVSGSAMEDYAITTSEDIPSTWTSLSTSATNIELEVKTTDNGTNYVWIKDENENIASATPMIQYVDNSGPTINDFYAVDITDSEFTVQLSTQDTDSGLSEIKWYYKKLAEEQYIEITDVYETDETNQTNNTSEIIKSYKFSGLENFTDYSIYAEVYDVLGNYTITETIEVTTSKIPVKLIEIDTDTEEISYKIDAQEYIENKKSEFESQVEEINNLYYGIEFENYSQLFATTEENMYYAKIDGSLSSCTEYYDENGLLRKYYTLNYILVSVEKELINFEVENKTAGKATVTLADTISSSDFSTTTSIPKLSVTCDSACIVLVSEDDGNTYSKVSEIEMQNENIYEFSFDAKNTVKILVILAGDINLNGSVNTADAMLITRSRLSSTESAYLELTEIEKIIADVNGNGTVNLADAMLIVRSRLSSTESAYQSLEW